MDIDVRGAEGLALVGKAVRQLGTDRTIVNNMAREIRTIGPLAKAKARESAMARLPRRGGLARWVASARVAVSVRRGAKSAGVTIRQGRNSKGGRSDLKRIDAGQTRHPLLGNRRHWYPQSVQAGYFTDAMQGDVADEFRRKVVVAVDRAVAEVLG